MAIKQRWQNYIDGQWCNAAGGEWIPIEDPATAQVISSIARGGPADVNRAVAAAQKAAQTRALYEMRPHDRMLLMLRIGAELRKMEDELASIITAENGKSISSARQEVQDAAGHFEYYAGLTGKLHGRSIPLGEGFLDYTQHVPMGVVGVIIPWNYPLEIAGRDIAPALACGNAIVVKSPSLCPIMLCFLAMAFERAGVPRGYFNLVGGSGSEVGESLAAHPGINALAFTGSTETGRSVAAHAAQSIIPCVLELGGKNPAVVYPDADLDQVAHTLGIGIWEYGGQVCSSCERLIVHHSVEEPLINRLVSWVKARTMGPGAEDHFFTPLISREQRDNAERFCQAALQRGARAVIGGRRADDLPGYYLHPTILTQVTPDMPCFQEEVFGPVVTVTPFDKPEEAVALANNTEYGLTAGVYTRGLTLAHWTADRLLAGSVYVNKWYAGGNEVPFGGFKHSGHGRMKTFEGLANYYQVRNVAIKL
jgi:acyl-CoA reductase-like NAD-dependent aldehyde dehydrogenase